MSLSRKSCHNNFELNINQSSGTNFETVTFNFSNEEKKGVFHSVQLWFTVLKPSLHRISASEMYLKIWRAGTIAEKLKQIDF